MDKKPDFSFMKTGGDLTDDGLTTDYKQTVVSMLTLFCENALNGGALYTKHANRKGITPEDIKTCDDVGSVCLHKTARYSGSG